MLTALTGKTILISGGTGSLGQELVKLLLLKNPKKVIIFSRGEYRQVIMKRNFNKTELKKLRWMIGDIRDVDRLNRAMNDVDYVIHTAAIKHVSVAEYNAFECIATNVIGTQNVINAAIDNNVRNVLIISSDKACLPINIYGSSKKITEHMAVYGNAYSGKHGTKISAIRFGNFIGSRGSVIELWDKLHADNFTLPITNIKCTRYWIELNEAALHVYTTLLAMKGGEIFVPYMKETSLLKLIWDRYGEDTRYEEIGLRVSEKLKETLLTEEEESRSEKTNTMWIIKPENRGL